MFGGETTVDEPRYNIRAVERMTGVPAPTLRSWERRYGFPSPTRTSTSRRLYSEREVAAVRWVKAQTERGLSVAQAVRWAQAEMAGDQPTLPPLLSEASPPGGRDSDRPSVPPPAPAAVPAEAGTPAGALPSPTADAGDAGPTEATERPAALAAAFVRATTRYDERAVEDALTAAFARYPTDLVLTAVVSPALVEIGERWAVGDLPVSAEHFASHIVRRRLYALLGAQPAAARAPAIVLACVPGEQHEIGLLMLAVFLRGAGVRVIYLGADVPLPDLARTVHELDAGAVGLSAITSGSAEALAEATVYLRHAGVHVPMFAGGPAALATPSPIASVPRGTPHAVVDHIMSAIRTA